MGDPKLLAVIMAGGSGTRFWPLSRKRLPKQYIAIRGQSSLIRQTVDRLTPLVEKSDIFVCSHRSHEPLLKEQLPEVSGLFLEPLAKNTTACCLFSVARLLHLGFSSSVCVVFLPADHFIEHPDRFRQFLGIALDFAKARDAFVTIGISPTSPHTGYGYIEAGDSSAPGVFFVKKFIEKPTADRATQFVEQGSFFWNAGMFVATLGTFAAAFEARVPREWQLMRSAVTSGKIDSVYPLLSSVPIDISVMERTSNIHVVPAAGIGWSDLGSWNALYELEHRENDPNVVLSGKVKNIRSVDCLVRVSRDKKIALVGVQNLIIIEDGDTILIADRESDQWVREAAAEFDP